MTEGSDVAARRGETPHRRRMSAARWEEEARVKKMRERAIRSGGCERVENRRTREGIAFVETKSGRRGGERERRRESAVAAEVERCGWGMLEGEGEIYIM